MRSHFRSRSSVRVLWVGFALTAVATAWAVHRLYDAVRREVAEQGTRAVQQELARAHAHIRDYTDTVRRTIIEELAGLHVDGLDRALRRWDESNTVVIGTFQWQTEPGFLAGATFPPAVTQPDELPALWRDFRNRSADPHEDTTTPSLVAGRSTKHFRLLDNPEFPTDKLGYQDENLEMLTYAGRPVDPWAGWAGHVTDASTPWVFWYQPGPDAPVRGCFIDVRLLVAELAGGLGDPQLARIELVPASAAPMVSAPSLADSLPAHALRATPGQLFLEKSVSARQAALTAALLLAVFLVGTAWLVHLSRQETRDAERKTTFVSQVSHELRTPLTSIRMFADMLGAPAVPEEKRIRFAGTISRESQRLGALIERLLTFAALEKGKPAGPLVPVDVGAVVCETIEEMDATLRAAGMRAEAALPAEAVIVATDRSTLKQALLNLVDNAVKYAREGGVVHLALTRTPDAVCVRVSDHGPGITRSLVGRLFEPFVQGSQALTDKAPGVGLGLSIARGLLRAAGGDLLLVSGRKGATFEIRLPPAPPS